MIRLYGPPDKALLRTTFNTLWSCRLDEDSCHVIDSKEIQSVVAMCPHSTGILGDEWEGQVFVVEKPGLDVAEMGGVLEEDDGDVE